MFQIPHINLNLTNRSIKDNKTCNNVAEKVNSYMTKATIAFLLLFLSFSESNAQNKDTEQIILNWTIPVIGTNNEDLPVLKFEGASYRLSQTVLPFYSVSKPSNIGDEIPSIELLNQQFEKLGEAELKTNVAGITNTEITIRTSVVFSRKKPHLEVTFIPIRKNPSTGTYEKLISATLAYKYTGNNNRVAFPQLNSFASSSVLASGDWFKIALTNDGIYKVTYSFLRNMGVESNSMQLGNIRLYGNGGGMVPQLNFSTRYDDLQENSIEVVDANLNGQFDQSDYFLFYGQGPDRWNYNTSDNRYHHQRNIYSDSAYYFITFSAAGAPKRINKINSLASSPTDRLVNSFTDYAFNEKNDYNFIKSGREWYGESFDLNASQQYSFNFPNIITDSLAYIKSSVIGRTPDGQPSVAASSRFNVKYNNITIINHVVSEVGTDQLSDFARPSELTATFNPVSSTVAVNYEFQPYNSQSNGWLNYIELNVKRNLVFSGTEFYFRDYHTSTSNIDFVMSSGSNGVSIWNISDPFNIFEQSFVVPQTGKLNFITAPSTNGASEFIAFTKDAYKLPYASGMVANQNLHALPAADYLIIANTEFLPEAERLADFHRTVSNLRVNVASTSTIYNEFSSGKKDVSAIRDFAKMFYDRALVTTDIPRYLLLFGDASYDYKNRISDNTDFVPTYEGDNSLSVLSSYATDDFFGFMDNNEGDFSLSGKVDIGIGRFPVKSINEGKAMVDKVITYSTSGNSNDTRLGDWRNVLCFIADDKDGITHIGQSERVLNNIVTTHPEYNIDKINIDAYQRVSTPGGKRYPEVNDAISRRVEKGALLINYTGHGGEVGWAHEQILTIPMINSWHNLNNLPAFVTATCEFSRYDDPQRISAGELVLLNPKGGAIGLYTTARVAFVSTNESLNTSFVRHLFDPINGEMPRMGDIYRLTKFDNAGVENFVLLGDPALRLAYPKYKIKTTAILNTTTQQNADTLQGLSRITVKGKVTDAAGQPLTTFNGVVYPTIFDKEVSINTLQNDPESGPYTFKLRKNIIYRGKASVINGDFSCSFIVPKDIGYQYGSGRLSYYAQNGTEDAMGYDENFSIGGLNASGINDDNGPKIKLYMNSDDFVFGGLTNNQPDIYAVLDDSSGINTVGNGIGHDITATLDGDQKNLFILNDYYESDLDNFQKGSVRYPMENISAGRHTLELKAWDINNNSTKVSTEFVVAESAELALQHVLNYPNPFTTHTTFMFEHNKPGISMWVQVQVFTVTGKLVKTLDKYLVNEGFRNYSLEWDGRDDFGDRIGKGVYIYRVKVKTADGETADKFERLVVLK